MRLLPYALKTTAKKKDPPKKANKKGKTPVPIKKLKLETEEENLARKNTESKFIVNLAVSNNFYNLLNILFANKKITVFAGDRKCSR